MPKEYHDLKNFLDAKVVEYNQPSFIQNDPVCIPHLFAKKQDIEIAALFAAVFAWGNRTTIINKSPGERNRDRAPGDMRGRGDGGGFRNGGGNRGGGRNN